MHRLSVIALTLLVVFASVLPTVFAETNAERFKRGYPPLPPTRREIAKRGKPSSTPPKTVSGFLQVRDSSGAHVLGFINNDPTSLPFLGVTPNKNSALQGTFSAATSEVQISGVSGSAVFLGVDASETYLTFDSDGADAKIWSINAATNELTLALPSTGAIFWDQTHNELGVSPDPTKAPASEVVKLYLST